MQVATGMAFLVAGLAGATIGWTSFAVAKAQPQQRGVDAPVDLTPGRAFAGETFREFPGDLGVIVEARCTENVRRLDGVLVRPTFVRASFHHRHALMGEAAGLHLLPADSSEPIDLSITGMDSAIDVPGGGPGDGSALRDFHVVLALQPGLTWGTVASFDRDLVATMEVVPR